MTSSPIFASACPPATSHQPPATSHHKPQALVWPVGLMIDRTCPRKAVFPVTTFDYHRETRETAYVNLKLTLRSKFETGGRDLPSLRSLFGRGRARRRARERIDGCFRSDRNASGVPITRGRTVERSNGNATAEATTGAGHRRASSRYTICFAQPWRCNSWTRGPIFD